jgi:hypothetical protein
MNTNVSQITSDLVFEGLAVNTLSTATCTCGISALDHELWNYTVEDGGVVVAGLS